MSGYTEVFAWGGDHFGQLGLAAKQTGKTYCVPRFCSFNVYIKQIACGEEHSAFIAQNGYVYTMGSNSEGRLGIGSRSVRQSASPCLVESLSSQPADYVSCGWGHTAVISRGALYTWGVGEYGALGLGTADTQWFPAQVPLPGDLSVLSVSCGSRHTGLVAAETRVRRKALMMTGAGEAGQLGTGRREKELSFVRVPLAEEVRQVSCGVFHTGVVTEGSRVYMMGGNSFGQLGLGTKKSSSIPSRVSALDTIPISRVACGHHSGAVSEYGELYLWGTGSFGEFLTPQVAATISAHVTDLAIGGSFGAAIDTQGSLWTWGSNTNGELGLGDYDQRVVPSLVVTLQGKKVKLVACGGAFCIALGADLSTMAPPSSSRSHVKKALSHNYADTVSPARGPRTQTPESGRSDRRMMYASDREQAKQRPPANDRNESIERIRLLEEELSEERKRSESVAMSRRLESDKLLTDTKALETELLAKDREIASLRVLNDRLTREKSSIEGRSFADSDVSQLQRRVEELNADIDGLMADSHCKDTEIAALRSANDRIADERDRFEALAREKDSALSASRSANEKNSLNRKEADDVIRRKDSEIAALKTDYRTLEAAKEREVASERYKVDVLMNDKSRAESEAASLRGEVARMLNEIKELERKNNELLRSVDSKESDMGRFLRDVDTLRRDKAELMTEVAQKTNAIESLQQQSTELKALLDTKAAELSLLRRDLDSASQARTLLSSDVSKSLNDIDSLKQQLADLRSRLSEREAELTTVRSALDSTHRERSNYQAQAARMESELAAVTANREKLSAGLDQQLKVTAQVKLNAEETNRRIEAEMRRKEEELVAQMNRLRESLEARVDLMAKQVREEKDRNNELRTVLSELEVQKRSLAENVQSGSSTLLGLQKDNDQLRNIIKSQEDQLSRANRELEESQKREKSLLAVRDELQRELERVRTQAASAASETQSLRQMIDTREKENASMTRENSQMQSAVEELKYEFEKLCQQHNEALEEMTKLQTINEDLHDQYQRSQTECERLTKEVSDLEQKNKEIFRNFEQELTNRARTFRERSLNALGTPSPLRPSQQTSPLPTEKSAKGAKVYGESSSRRSTPVPDFSKKLVKAAERMIDLPPRKQQENISPTSGGLGGKELHSFRNMSDEPSEEENLPQFAPREVSAGVQDIRSRLHALKSSKADLESKMLDLQRRMQEEPLTTEELYEEEA